MPVHDPLPEADPFDLIRRLGVEVIESRTLKPPGVLYREHSIALVRTGQDRPALECLADQMLAALASPVPGGLHRAN